MPLDNLHRLDDGTTLDHRAIHNVFGMENAPREPTTAFSNFSPTSGPFVLTRARRVCRHRTLCRHLDWR